MWRRLATPFLLLALAGSLWAAAQGTLGPIAELRLNDGTVLHEVTIIGYGNKVVTARWQGGRGTILHTQLPWEWRKIVEARRPEDDSKAQTLGSNVKQGPASNILVVGSGHEIKLTGRIRLNPAEENGEIYYFEDAVIRIYALKEGEDVPQISPGPSVELGTPLAETKSDQFGNWTMPPFQADRYFLQAVGQRVVEKTGYGASWEWRIKNSDIVEVGELILDEDNALPVVRTWSKKHSSVIRREEREKKKTFLKRIFGWFGN